LEAQKERRWPKTWRKIKFFYGAVTGIGASSDSGAGDSASPLGNDHTVRGDKNAKVSEAKVEDHSVLRPEEESDEKKFYFPRRL